MERYGTVDLPSSGPDFDSSVSSIFLGNGYKINVLYKRKTN